MKDYFDASARELNEIIKETLGSNSCSLAEFAEKTAACLKSGGKIMLAGNGGSAADAQHIAAEFVVRLKEDRRAYPAIALTTDTSVLTACGNDLSFEMIFSRQIEALGKEEDIFIALSTSGNSPNILLAAEKAREKGIYTAGITGKSGGKLKELCDININIKSEKSMRIQEAYMFLMHTACELIENTLAGGD
ncbi:MAG: SIS domain-containing protein [Candidatus Goldiibacteriota bacterium]